MLLPAFLLLAGGAALAYFYLHNSALLAEQQAKRAELVLDAFHSAARVHLRRDLYNPYWLQSTFNGLGGISGLEGARLTAGGEKMAAAGELPPDASDVMRHRRVLHLARESAADARPAPRGRGSGWQTLPAEEQLLEVWIEAASYRQQVWNLHLQVLLGAAVLAASAVGFGLVLLQRRRQRELAMQLLLAEDRAAHDARLAHLGAGLAHETKNPLGLIRGFAQNMAHDPAAPHELRRQAAIILDESDRIVRRLNDFLAFARPVEPQLRPEALAPLCQSVIDLVAHEAAEKGVALQAPLPHVKVLIDDELFRRALLNLLVNALAACQQGDQITLRLEEDSNGLALAVRDTGAGIAPEDLGRVREPYFSRTPAGAGLGLAIVEEIAAAHGWRLRIDSAPNEGCSVVICGLKAVD